MKTILVLGAGFSSRSLIDYLLQNAVESNWKILVGDINQARADAAIGNHPAGKAVKFDVHNDHDLKTYIAKADLVVSMLPARFHPLVAAHCLTEKANLLTASYLSPEMRQMDKQARERDILFINELGLDPGIDHMSAIRILQHIRENGGTPVSFKSYTGGLIAPESDNNPWNYKFTWNPRNVVLAGQGCASFIENSQIRYIPYQQLFKRTQLTEISGAGTFEVYPNRNSLIYRTIYNLPDIPTLIRGTLRRPGFCEAWDVFVQLGMTDDSCHLEGSENLTARKFINTFLPGPENEPVQSKLSRQLNLQPEGAVMKKLAWLGLFDEEPVGLPNATPAQILQKILTGKWMFQPEDKDMIVMQHLIEYQDSHGKHEWRSSLVVTGKDQVHTAMAITVGSPLAIAASLLLNGSIRATGVRIPNTPDLYLPILNKLEQLGIKFTEEIIDL